MLLAAGVAVGFSTLVCAVLTLVLWGDGAGGRSGRPARAAFHVVWRTDPWRLKLGGRDVRGAAVDPPLLRSGARAAGRSESCRPV